MLKDAEGNMYGEPNNRENPPENCAAVNGSLISKGAFQWADQACSRDFVTMCRMQGESGAGAICAVASKLLLLCAWHTLAAGSRLQYCCATTELVPCAASSRSTSSAALPALLGGTSLLQTTTGAMACSVYPGPHRATLLFHLPALCCAAQHLCSEQHHSDSLHFCADVGCCVPRAVPGPCGPYQGKSGSKYTLNTDKRDWATAEQNCNKIGGHLAAWNTEVSTPADRPLRQNSSCIALPAVVSMPGLACKTMLGAGSQSCCCVGRAQAVQLKACRQVCICCTSHDVGGHMPGCHPRVVQSLCRLSSVRWSPSS